MNPEEYGNEFYLNRPPWDQPRKMDKPDKGPLREPPQPGRPNPQTHPPRRPGPGKQDPNQPTPKDPHRPLPKK
jgi:hypothetical protein